MMGAVAKVCDIEALHQAMRFCQDRADTQPGAATAALRQRIANGTPLARLSFNQISLVKAEAARLMAIGINDMPPESDDIAILIDALAFKIGASSRATAWASIGIPPRTGDRLVVKNRSTVRWPVWFTLRHAALGQ